ncbi:MAG: aspartate 1-decarboxylase [Candidatus Omnitrophica bacterium]|nr:aspartate 1-decarboxylase [Candidatus Omnitrophota bacterium]
MLRSMMKSKIHRATVTEANLRYQGSITIDADLLKAADLIPGEQVQVVNVNNGSRIETYVVEGAAGSGTVCMNGAAARWAQPGDTVILISYGLMEDRQARELKPRIVFVDRDNRIRDTIGVG